MMKIVLFNVIVLFVPMNVQNVFVEDGSLLELLRQYAADVKVETKLNNIFKSTLFRNIQSSDPDKKIVEDCFYVHSWMVDKKHHCYVVANSDVRSDLTPRERKQRFMFEQLLHRDRADRKLVADCFANHRFDNHISCWGISWGGRDLLGNAEKTRREVRIKQIWNDLVEKEFKREMRCLYHPWMDYEDC